MRLITQLLQRSQGGDAYAHDALSATAYRELRRMAERRLHREQDRWILRTSGLVHECCLGFAGAAEMNGCDWPQFFAFAPSVMRRLVLDLIDECAAERRRTGAALHLSLVPAVSPCLPGDEPTILWMDRAIETLEIREARLAQIARMQYFCGYTTEETADALCITQRAAMREWLKVLALLSIEHVPGAPFLPAQDWSALARELFGSAPGPARPPGGSGRPH